MKMAWGSTVLVLAAALAAACGGDDVTTDDMGNSVLNVACTANEKSCLNDKTAFVCLPNGKAVVSVQCSFGEKCTAGECKADANIACSSADNGCMDATTALRCNPGGAGFAVATCPAGTQCAGPGLCQGACVIGSSICLDSGHVATCNDGKSYVTTACGATESCVATGSNPIDTAACKAADCKPDANGCDFVCGNKADPAAANQTTTMSTCVETPLGFKWLAIQCPGVTSCNPAGASCNGGTQAACKSECTPGDSRCAGQLETQTCGADGKWPATSTACNAAGAAIQYVCSNVPNATNKVYCADFACSDGGKGACDEAGKFHACGDDGHLAAAGTACAAGLCVITNSNGPPGALQPGSCKVQCQSGDEQCIGGSTYVTCANGLWSAPLLCASGKNCQQTSLNGAPRKVCGDCIPGSRECGGTNGTQIRVCKTDATWEAAYSDCAVGSCFFPNQAIGAVCVAECFPGKKVCGQQNTTVPGVNIAASDSEGVCTAQGRLPAALTTCGTGQYCRRGPAQNGNPGTALGCLTCVGTQNEFGLRDSKCSSDDGTANIGNYLTLCKTDNSGWDGANNNICVAPNDTCNPASTNISIPQIYGSYCHNDWFGLATQSNLQNFFGETCQSWYGGNSAPMSCAVPNGSPVGDCCSNRCYAAQQPTPATCQ